MYKASSNKSIIKEKLLQFPKNKLNFKVNNYQPAMDTILSELANPVRPILIPYREALFHRVVSVIQHTDWHTPEHIVAVKKAALDSNIFTTRQKNTIRPTKAAQRIDDEPEYYYSDDCDSM